MPITKCSEINTQVYEEADEEALTLVASSFADYSDPNDPALFASMTGERLIGLAMILVHRNTTHMQILLETS